MTVSVDWFTKIISVQKTDMSLIQTNPTEIRELDLNWFRLELKSLEDDEAGMPFPATHRHNTEVTVGGLTLARVIEIINDYTITFEDGQYAVNLVGANSNVGDRVNVNQVSVRTANSAGMVTSQAIEYGEYGGGVSIDVTSGNSGVVYPAGTPRKPVDNLADALAISVSRGFNKLFIIGDLTLADGDDVSDYEIYGKGATLNSANTIVTMIDGCVTSGTKFEDCYLEGVQGGEVYGKHCVIGAVSHSHCEWSQCIMIGPMELYTPTGYDWTSGHTTDSVNCRTSLEWFELDYNGSNLQQSYNDFSGNIKVTNMTGIDSNMAIRMDHGKVWIDSTCTAGTITVIGIGTIINEGTGTVVDRSNLVNSLDAVYKGKIFIDTAGTSGTAYPLGTFNDPVDNVADALTLLTKYDCNTLHFHSSATVGATDVLDNLVLEGHNASDAQVTITSGASTTDCKFRRLNLTGTMSDKAEYDDCKLSDITNLAGVIKGCSLDGTLTCINGSTLGLSNCKSLTQTPPTVSVGTCAVNGTNWFGFMNIDDKSGSEEFNIHCGYGYMIIGTGCTAGSMYLAGFGHSVDNSVGATVNDTDLVDPGHLNDIPDEQVFSI